MGDNIERINPWLEIWIHPTKTIQYLLANESAKRLLILQLVGGVVYSITKFNIIDFSFSIIYIILAKLIVGLLAGFIVFKIGSSIITMTGKWIGGKGQDKEVLIALVWANLPIIVAIVFWAPLFMITGKPVPNGITIPNHNGLLYNCLASFRLFLEIWGTIILIIFLKEVQKFSIWKSIANILIATVFSILIILIPLLLLSLLQIFS